MLKEQLISETSPKRSYKISTEQPKQNDIKKDRSISASVPRDNSQNPKVQERSAGINSLTKYSASKPFSGFSSFSL